MLIPPSQLNPELLADGLDLEGMRQFFLKDIKHEYQLYCKADGPNGYQPMELFNFFNRNSKGKTNREYKNWDHPNIVYLALPIHRHFAMGRKRLLTLMQKEGIGLLVLDFAAKPNRVGPDGKRSNPWVELLPPRFNHVRKRDALMAAADFFPKLNPEVTINS